MPTEPLRSVDRRPLPTGTSLFPPTPTAAHITAQATQARSSRSLPSWQHTLLAAGLALTLAACGGSGDESGNGGQIGLNSTDTTGLRAHDRTKAGPSQAGRPGAQTSSSSSQAAAAASGYRRWTLSTPAEASRFLAQASYGSNPKDIKALTGRTANEWIEAQFLRPRSGLVNEQDSRLLAVPGIRGGGGANPLIEQLRMVSRIIASRQSLGVRRQVFFVSLGGFDTHGGQKTTQNRLLVQVDQALEHFVRQMQILGVEDQVTLFTASDFGRSMLTNGSGTDHGWGSHHFVVGGAVQGGRLYGQFPAFGRDVGQDVNGRLVPRYSVEQYAAALGRWFGLSDSNLLQVLPNLRNFDARALTFMKV